MSIDFDPTVDYYKALGVDAKAKPEEIKRAYRKLAKQYHPDSTGGDKSKEQRFKEISTAYEVLGDAKQRAQYDELRANGGRRPSPFSTGGPGFGGEQVWDLGDLFSQMFAGGGGPRAAGPGARRSVRFERGDDDDGWVFETRTGGPGGRRGPPQAAHPPVESKVQASDGSWLTVKGNDVHSDVRVPFHHAILGTVAEVPTVAGKSSVKIPPGTSSGRRLRLRGKGVVTDAGTGPGDHIVTIHLDVPTELDDKGKKLLLELANHVGQGGPTRSTGRK